MTIRRSSSLPGAGRTGHSPIAALAPALSLDATLSHELGTAAARARRAIP